MVCSAFQDMTVASGSGCTLRLFCICIYNWSGTPFLTEKKRCKQTRALLPSWSVLGVAAAAFTLSAALMCALLNRARWTFFIKGTVCGLSFFSSLRATVWSTRVESHCGAAHICTQMYIYFLIAAYILFLFAHDSGLCLAYLFLWETRTCV